MNGNGGPFTVLLALFVLGILFVMRLLFYLLVAAAAILIGIGQLIALGWRAYKRRKAAKELRTRKPPEPTLSESIRR